MKSAFFSALAFVLTIAVCAHAMAGEKTWRFKLQSTVDGKVKLAMLHQ